MERTTIESVLARLVPNENGCLEWTGYVNPSGYGYVTARPASPQRVHRYVWTHLVGPIPDGTNILHRCDNRRCANVEHLFLGSHSDNHADMVSKGRNHRNQPKAACPQGHAYEGDNVMIDKKGKRRCRACARAASRCYRARRF